MPTDKDKNNLAYIYILSWRLTLELCYNEFLNVRHSKE